MNKIHEMKMKDILRNAACAVFALAVLVGCIPDPVLEPDFSVDDIYGKWCSGTVYYRYDYGYQGVTWDTADDMSEYDGQLFTWEIVGYDMTHIHIMEMGASVPKTYVIDELTPSVLRYHDAYGKSYLFYKVGY